MNIVDLFRTALNSLYFNYKIFGLRNMYKFWAIIGPHTYFSTLTMGAVKLHKPSFGCLKIGVGLGSFHKGKNMHSFINIGKNTRLEVEGKVSMDRGVVFNLTDEAIVILGDGFKANYGLTLSIAKSFICERNVRLGWDVTIIDSDGHTIKFVNNNQQVNNNHGIHIRENTWLAAKCAIMKGVHLAKYNIIPYGNIITKSNDSEYTIYGGVPNKVLKSGVYWDYTSETQHINSKSHIF